MTNRSFVVLDMSRDMVGVDWWSQDLWRRCNVERFGEQVVAPPSIEAEAGFDQL